MSAPLKELDIILFRKKGSIFKDFIGNCIEWLQWGLDCKSSEYIHVAIVTRDSEGLTLFETNPPRAKYRKLESINIQSVTVLSRTTNLTEDQFKKSREWCKKEQGREYGYNSILKFMILGLWGRLGYWFRNKSRSILRKHTPAFNKVCSVLVDDLFYEILDLDILPDIGEGNALPGDMILSTAHQIQKTLTNA